MAKVKIHNDKEEGSLYYIKSDSNKSYYIYIFYNSSDEYEFTIVSSDFNWWDGGMIGGKRSAEILAVIKEILKWYNVVSYSIKLITEIESAKIKCFEKADVYLEEL